MPLLVQYYPDTAPNVLMELLTSSSSTVRLKSVELLGELAAKNTAKIDPALLKPLNDAEPAIRSLVLQSLLKLHYRFLRKNICYCCSTMTLIGKYAKPL